MASIRRSSARQRLQNISEDAGSLRTKLDWTPIEADASAAGDYGYTRGTWIYTAKKPDGSDVKVTGYYVTGWKLQADGTYKFILDIGGADTPAQ